MTTILIINDRLLTREFLATVLGSASYRVLEATTGMEGLKLVKSEDVDLIITNILSPAVDGFDLVNHLHENPDLEKIPIIFYTSIYRLKEARALAKKCGVHFVLKNQSKSHLLLETVQKALGNTQSLAIAKFPPVVKAISSGPLLTRSLSITELNKMLSKRFKEIDSIKKNFKAFVKSSHEFAEEHQLSLDTITSLSKNIKELQTLTNQLVNMTKVNLNLFSEKNPSKFLRIFCNEARKVLRAKHSVLGIFNENGRELKYFLVSEKASSLQSKMDIPLLVDKGLVGRILKQRAPVKINNSSLISKAELFPNHPSITNFLGFPILSKTHLYGFIYFTDKVDGTIFNDEDFIIGGTLVSGLSLSHENFEFYETIQHHATKLQIEILERKKAQTSLIKSELLFRQFAENITEVFWRTTPNMDEFLYVSPSYKDIWGHSSKSLYANPQEWFESIVPEDQPIVRKTFDKLMQGKVPNISVEFRILRPDGEIRNIYSRGFHLKDEKGQLLLGVASDITEFQQAKEMTKVQNGILNNLKKAHSVKDITTQAIVDVCNTLNFDMGSIWMIDPIEKVLRCIDVWSRDYTKMDRFIKKSFELSFEEGIGLPGTVWKNNEPLWVPHLSRVTKFSSVSLATKVGLKSAYVCPISYRNKVYGVMEFFLSHVPKFDPELFDMVNAISDQLGEFICLKHTEEQLTYISHHDILTDLMNRSTFEEVVNKKIETSPSFIGVILLDIDRFKRISEEMGHDAGDLLLQAVAKRMSNAFKPEEATIARLGGDKFILALTNFRSIEEIKEAIEKVQNLFKDSFPVKREDVFITTSIGVSIYPENGVDTKILLKKAEIALARVKEQGGNHFRFSSSSIQALSSEQVLLESSLRRALDEDQFCLYYQPMVNLKTGHFCGIEALIRWNHPERGLLSPISFISVAEQSDIIVHIGEWVLHEVCRQIKNKEIFATEEVPISVNLSVLQFNERHNLIGYLIKLIDEFGINPNVLELEVTEGVLAKDMEESFRLLNKISKMDIRISLDDFGTGYSSLKYLQYFPVNKIKIDKSFIDGLPHNPQNIAIIRAVIALSQGLGKKVIAEGVETEEQLNFLIKENCDEMQGYYFSKPLPADKIKKMIMEGKHLNIKDNDKPEDS